MMHQIGQANPSPRYWHCGRFALPLGQRTLLMAILNATPDSFSGDGLYGEPQRLIELGLQAEADGADLIDVGGESTRPRNVPVEEAEERRRVLPVIVALARQARIPISVDTSKPGVAAAALEAGASVVNDVSGLAGGDATARLVASSGAGLVLMRFPGFPLNRPAPRPTRAPDLLADVKADLARSVERALAVGVPADRIAVDPGFGFGLVPDDSIRLLRRLAELRALGYPLLVGVSRKGFTGRPEGLPPEERQWGTAAAHALAIANGADVLRVHDVVAARRVARFSDLVCRPSDH